MERPFLFASRLATSRPAARLFVFTFVSLFWAERAPAVFVEGIDVSHWQGNINWTSVKNAGIKFAFTKATEGVDYVDPRYHANMQGARAAGVYIGPYHFCRVESKNGVPFTSYDGSPFAPGSDPHMDALTEAEDFLDAILPYYQTGQHLPPVADVERLPDFGNQTLNRLFISNWVQIFSDTVYDTLGVRPLIYTSRFGANTRYTSAVASSHELWLAWWRGTGTTQPPSPSDTPLWDPWLFWQWTDEWSVAGISGDVDGDVFNGTLPELEALLLGKDGSIPGDFNRDGSVGAADYVLWRKSQGQTVPLYTGADANGNARVDDNDYALWRSHFGQTGGAGSSPAVLAGGVVPEPSGVVLTLFGAVALLLTRVRLRRTACERLAATCCIVAICLAAARPAAAQQASVSAWDAAEFRIWGFIPNWSGEAGTSVVDQLNAMSAANTYNHVSDVIYFGGVQPTATGGLAYHSTAVPSLNTLKSLSEQHGFGLHMSMFTVSGGSVDSVWTSIVSNPTYRANFVNNVVNNVLVPYNMSGFNFDWERPNTATKWGNYTQLARELGDVIRPLGMEVSVDDYGFADSRWDDTALFDARVYDQLFIMGYHYGASSNETFANGKLALTGQGTEKAFKDEQLAIGVGTWGSGGPATVTLRNFVAANPNLPYNAGSITGTYVDVNGVTRTGTWNIESRQQVREKTQLALDRDMPGMFSWTLHYDARNEYGLHRVMHHYSMFQRGIPDLNLDGKVDAADAHALADNMGSVPGWTGTNTAARFDDFYLSGNWEQGDRDGNGFVNQQDADWLAGRFAALGVNLPDRLGYSGTFENFQNSRGLTGRWRAKRETGGNLRETGNYTQHGPDHFDWFANGVGSEKHSDYAVTIRNQNAAEKFDNLNTLPRQMQVDLESPIDLSKHEVTYVTLHVQQKTGPVLASQLASSNRTLSLEFLDAAGANQFEITLRGSQEEFAIQHQADAGGEDVSRSGFSADSTYMFVGKISGNGNGANTIQASLWPNYSSIGNFAEPNYPWMLTAESSDGFNPTITDLQFTSLFEANYTVSNVWTGTAADLFALPSSAMGDFNGDGIVTAADYIVWRSSLGQSGALLAADGDGNGWVDAADYAVWASHLGQTVGAGAANGPSLSAVPEPAAGGLMLMLVLLAAVSRSATWHGRR